MDSFTIGERVTWNTPQGLHAGTVVERRTDEFMLGRQHFAACEDKPVYLIESDTTGARCAHAPEVLRSSGPGSRAPG